MKPTMKILENISKNSANNHDEVFTRVYRYMLRSDMYFSAYQKLYANKGASTKGVNDDTVDGFGKDKIEKLIKSLADETYKPSPVRRIYIAKSSGKMRPLGIPTFSDKLVQEVLKQILQAIYEPLFLNCSHGFRPKRSCHTALNQITKGFNGIKWFIEGDIKGCFDNINHHKLIEIINKKIRDARIIKLIWKFLKAGYLEDWKYHKTHSGTPQGGIISPILANIYLHELDKKVTQIAKEFEKKPERARSKEYVNKSGRILYYRKKAINAEPQDKAKLIAKVKELRKQIRKIPYTDQSGKVLKYVRYADDFIIGIKGSKEDCVMLRSKLAKFIAEELKMELSKKKTLITHSSEYARFLGYDIKVRRDSELKRVQNGNKYYTARTKNGTVELLIPNKEKIMKSMFEEKIIKQNNGIISPIARSKLINCTDLEIIEVFNAELRGICGYYSLASNFNDLNYFNYLMEYSCLKTLAGKHKCTLSKIKTKLRDGHGKWCIPYQTKAGENRRYFVNYQDCKKVKYVEDIKSNVRNIFKYSRTTLESRLNARKCEYCGTENAKNYEIHHVNKVKNLKGKELWERMMIAKQRKTMVLCKECHYEIHGRTYGTMESRIHREV